MLMRQNPALASGGNDTGSVEVARPKPSRVILRIVHSEGREIRVQNIPHR
jgi:hypothetical protein